MHRGKQFPNAGPRRRARKIAGVAIVLGGLAITAMRLAGFLASFEGQIAPVEGSATGSALACTVHLVASALAAGITVEVPAGMAAT
jgi:hypothetical protein